MSVIDISVPDIGDFHDIPVIDILVKPGDSIKKEDALVTLESDKATMDIPASADGVVQEIKVKVGDKVSQGSIVLSIEQAGAATEVAAAVAESTQTPAPPQAATTVPAPAPQVEAPHVEPIITTAAQPDSPSTGNGKSHLPNGEPSSEVVHASPVVRRFARELGVSASAIRGSGPNGRITREDVQDYVKRALRDGNGAGPSASGSSGLQIAPQIKVDFAQFGPTERVALTRIQRISGPLLHRNWVTIPHVTSNDDADVTGLEEFRQILNAEQKGISSGDARPVQKLTMLAFLVKACVAALKKYPRFNSSLDGDAIVLKQYYHIGVAADTPDGLLVPVIRNADQKGFFEIAAEMSELAGKARAGKLSAAEMQGGTFSISSLGGIGGTYFTPIINAPEVAILGVCQAATRPVWNGGAFEPKLMLPLSLSWDHRVVDGAAAARFLRYLIEILGDMRRTLL